MDSASESIRASGWRQGRFVVYDDVESLLDAAIDHVLNREKLGDETRLIVISQDCDLVRDLKTEPYVELILCKQVPTLNPLYRNGRNPRMLHIPVSDSKGGSIVHEFSVHDRFRVKKESIQTIFPDDASRIEEKYRKLLCGWVAKRYDRPAFPDAFNRRIASADNKLERLFKSKKGQAITGILLDDIEVKPEEDLTLAELRHFRRLDKDYRSLPEKNGIARMP